MPAECPWKPDRISQPCAACGQCDWNTSESNDSLVFLLAEIVRTKFPVYTCSCGVRCHVDGKEYAIFRKSQTLAFGLEVLYEWSGKMDMGFPDSWSSSWKTILKRLKGYPETELAIYQTRFKQQYTDAIMGFVNLQSIDYDAGFRCACSQGELVESSAERV